MKSETLYRELLFAGLFAFTVSSLVYFGFGNIYSSDLFNAANFDTQFRSGIYQYRLLSGWMLKGISAILESLNIDYEIFRIKFLNPSSEPQFYLALYILNTFFTVCTATVAVLISRTREFAATFSERILMVTAVSSIIALTQFVIVPYDASSYFFMLFFLLVFINYLRNQSARTLVFLILILVISTLNRESSALSLATAGALLYTRFGLSRKFLVPVGVLAAVFIVMYFSLRFFSNSFTTNDGNLLIQNFTDPKNWLGILFWTVLLSLSLMISNNTGNRSNIIIFHIFALPYIAMCFYSGILYEARLYVPLFVISIMLSKLTFPHKRLTADISK